MGPGVHGPHRDNHSRLLPQDHSLVSSESRERSGRRAVLTALGSGLRLLESAKGRQLRASPPRVRRVNRRVVCLCLPGHQTRHQLVPGHQTRHQLMPGHQPRQVYEPLGRMHSSEGVCVSCQSPHVIR